MLPTGLKRNGLSRLDLHVSQGDFITKLGIQEMVNKCKRHYMWTQNTCYVFYKLWVVNQFVKGAPSQGRKTPLKRALLNISKP